VSHSIGWSCNLSVAPDGRGLVGHGGAAHLRALADRTGLTGALSKALGKPFDQRLDRGVVLVETAMMIALGGRAISDIRLFEHTRALFGPPVSDSTVWRALNEIDPVIADRVERARATIRRHVWKLLAARPEGFPDVMIAGKAMAGWCVLDIDASLVDAASAKESAAATWKKGFGFHPFLVTCDNTAELLVVRLRPGNAGSNTASDHISVLREAVRQLPAVRRRRVLVRIDGAGASHAVTAWIATGDGHPSFIWEYSTGFTMTGDHEHAITLLPRDVWDATVEVCGGQVRANGQVAELAGLLDLTAWPGMRLLVRRERPCARHSRALTAFEKARGYRYQLIATNTPDRPGRGAQWLEARHRGHVHVETRGVEQAKDSGLRRMPSKHYPINQAWCQAIEIATDLRRWLQLLALHDQPDLVACEPGTLRFRFLSVPARLVHHARRKVLRIPPDWPWAQAITLAWNRLQALPTPT
jgi:Transposase DDE domain group 1